MPRVGIADEKCCVPVTPEPMPETTQVQCVPYNVILSPYRKVDSPEHGGQTR